MPTTAILGGGIGGLSAAYYLLQRGANAISLFETSTRLGGWIKTEQHRKLGFRFETGPRTIRPGGIKGQNTLRLIEELGMGSRIIPISRKHVAAKNRMIFVNNQLCLLPSSSMSLFRKLPPFSKPLIYSILNDLKTGRSRSVLTDETIYSFIERRFGTEMAKYLISSLICGICAGDAKQISVKFLMEDMFRNEQRHGSVIKGMLYSFFDKQEKSDEIIVKSKLGKRSHAEGWSVYSFKNGMEELPNTLTDHLVSKGIDIKNNSECREIHFDKGEAILNINGADYHRDFVISSIQSYTLAKLVEKQHPDLSADLNGIPYVDVAVVNLQYDENELLQPPAFGFLVPPSENLPILGVIFDSCCFNMNGKTVATVMMGGAWFKEKFGSNPTHRELYEVATKHVADILKIKSKPATGRVNVLEKCIPQYVVGHHDRVKRIREYIQRNQLPLALCGAAYDGVGVNDVIYSAKQSVKPIRMR